MKNTLESRLGVFFALAILAAGILLEMIGSFDFFKPGVRVRALFGRVLELKEGDPVKMAGVDIGRVEDITLQENKVAVTLKLTKPNQVKTDSKATIKFVGLMGQNYVSIDFGSPQSPPVQANAILETADQADLASLMVKLENVATGVDNLTKSFSGENLNNLLGPINDFLQENSPRLSGILSNAHTVSAQIASGQGTVGKLIMDEALHDSALATVTNLNATADDLKATLAEARKVVDQVNQGQGTIGKLIQDEALYKESTAAVTNLREIFEKINKGQGSVGKLVNDETMFKNLKMTLQKVDKATEGIEDQGPLSVLGIAVGSLF